MTKHKFTLECLSEIVHYIFHGTRTNNPNIYMEPQDTELPKQSWGKKNKARGISLSDFMQCCKATVIKTAQYWQNNNRYMDQWIHRIESPKINLHMYSPLIFDKGVKNTQWRKESLLGKWSWENWTAIYKSMKLEHTLIS